MEDMELEVPVYVIILVMATFLILRLSLSRFLRFLKSRCVFQLICALNVGLLLHQRNPRFKVVIRLSASITDCYI